MSTAEWLQLASIPVFTGAIGWLINWSGVLMLFNPVRFHGVDLAALPDHGSRNAMEMKAAPDSRPRVD